MSAQHSIQGEGARTSWQRTLALGGLCTAVITGAGCGVDSGSGGDGGGGSIVGLSVAQQMSVVEANNMGGAATVTPHAGVVTPADLSNSDYDNDAVHTNVYDPSMETLQTVNEILCMLTQTSYADLVNFGNYNAQIDENLCSQGSDSSSSSSGQSSGAEAKAPQIWAVHSERGSNGSNQVVEFWVPQHDEGGGGAPDGTIWGKMVISEAASADNPFGVFVLNFAGVPDGGTIDDAFMKGTLRTLDVADGFVGFSFYEEQGDITQVPDPDSHVEIVQGNVNVLADQSAGVAYIRLRERSNYSGQGDTGIVESTYSLAFDDEHVLRAKDTDPGVCLSRTEFNESVWRYNLYEADGENAGERVELNSGFGFKTEDGDYGWAGYYGVWTAPGATLASGDTVTQDVYGVDNPATYTVVKAPGKLIKNTKHELALVYVANEQFEWWDFGDPNQPQQGPPTQYKVQYTNGFFFKVAVWDGETHTYEDLGAPEVIDMQVYGHLGMWSQSLGGSVSYVDPEDFITYYAQQFVNGSSELFTSATEVDFYGYFDCLRADITALEAEEGSVYETPSLDVMEPYHYVFKKADLTLYRDTDGMGDLVPAGLATGEVPTSGPFTWGLRNGPLVLDTSGLLNTNAVWNEDVFYTYETGPNPWNQYAALIDANSAPVVFDPPIQFTYTHQTANDLNESATYDGKNFFLNYNGPGNLFGIPSEGVDLDGDDEVDRWYPLFSIAGGTVMGPSGTEYIVKPIEIEQTLDEDVGGCVGMSVDDVDDLELPDISGFTPPNIGPKPVINDPPVVIEGVVQGG